SLANSLRRAVAIGRAELAEYAAALLGGRDTTAARTRLLGQVVAIENLRASAIFEDHEIQARNDALRQLDVAMLGVVDIAHLLGRSLDRLRHAGAVISPGLYGAMAAAAATIDLWRSGEIDVNALRRRFVQASVQLPLAWQIYREPHASDDEVIRRATVI